MLQDDYDKYSEHQLGNESTDEANATIESNVSFGEQEEKEEEEDQNVERNQVHQEVLTPHDTDFRIDAIKCEFVSVKN